MNEKNNQCAVWPVSRVVSNTTGEKECSAAAREKAFGKKCQSGFALIESGRPGIEPKRGGGRVSKPHGTSRKPPRRDYKKREKKKKDQSRSKIRERGECPRGQKLKEPKRRPSR